MSNLLLAFVFCALAVGFVLLFSRGWKRKVIELSETPRVKSSTQVRVVAAPIETLVTDGEPGSLKHDWQPEMQLRYTGSTELNRIYTTLSRTLWKTSPRMVGESASRRRSGWSATLRPISSSPGIGSN